MRQRLGLATALLCDPEILILDEPANGLDPEGVHWLRRLLRELAAEGRTVLVSSHILAEVAQTVDSVVIMDHGRLVTQSTLEQLTERAAQVIRVRTPRPEQLAAILVENGATARLDGPDRLEVTGASGELIGTPDRRRVLGAKAVAALIAAIAIALSLLAERTTVRHDIT